MPYPSLANAVWIDGQMCKPGDCVEFRNSHFPNGLAARLISSLPSSIGMLAEIELGEEWGPGQRTIVATTALRKVKA